MAVGMMPLDMQIVQQMLLLLEGMWSEHMKSMLFVVAQYGHGMQLQELSDFTEWRLGLVQVKVSRIWSSAHP